MTAQNDLDRTLDAWFGAEAAPAVPPEPLVRILESTRGQRPRPSCRGRYRQPLGRCRSDERHRIGGGEPPPCAAHRTRRADDPCPRRGGAPGRRQAVGPGAVAALVPQRARRRTRHVHADARIRCSSRSPTAACSSIGGADPPRHTALVYDPVTGASVSAGPMVSAGQLVVSSAVRLLDGRVLVVGDAVDPDLRPGDDAVRAGRTDGHPPVGRIGGPAGRRACPDRRRRFTGSTRSPALQSAELFDPGR